MYKSKNNLEVVGDIAYLYTSKNERITISSLDIPKVMQITWHIHKSGYVQGRLANKIIKLHRYIMDCPQDLFVDHIDRDKLNNTRNNLRICTRKINNQNKGVYKNNHAESKGVSFIPRLNKWRARVYIEGKEIHLGVYDTKDEAISQRILAEKTYYEGSVYNV